MPVFAYMKQSVPVRRWSYLFLFCAVVFSACFRLPRYYSSPHVSPETKSLTGKTHASVLVNINSASVAELEQLPGIGPGLAERIVTHRQEHGPFRRAEHLMMVRGISDRKFREIRLLVRVE